MSNYSISVILLKKQENQLYVSFHLYLYLYLYLYL